MHVSVTILPWSEAAPEAARIRMLVFVEEQGVAPDIEMDEWDTRCEHALARDASGCAVGTGRLLPDGHVGRMAVVRSARGKAVGSAILRALMERARARGLERVELTAQTRAVGFYERHRFTVCSGEFHQAGIPHVRMTREL